MPFHLLLDKNVALCRAEQVLGILRMDWLYKQPARAHRPSDNAQQGLNDLSPLLGTPQQRANSMTPARGRKACVLLPHVDVSTHNLLDNDTRGEYARQQAKQV